MKDKNLSRREREKLRQRREMLDTAIELFSEKGYHNVSMQAIAEKAEFAIGTIYKFFKNKDDLYKVLMIEQAKLFHEAVMESLEAEDDELEKLRNYMKAKGKVFMENAAFIRLYFAETRGASFAIKAGFDSEMKEMHDRMLHAMAAVFESGIKKKRFRRIAEPYHLAIALESIGNAFLFEWLEERQPYPEDPDIILNIVFKGLIDDKWQAANPD